MLTCKTCGKSYDPAKERHEPRMAEETRGIMVIRYATGCKVEKV